MSELRIIPVTFNGKRYVVTNYRMQYDWGQVLYFTDLDLPEAFEARFSNAPTGESVGQIGTNNRIRIPKQFFESGEPIYCYITLHDEETDGRTVYTVKIPIKVSSDRTDAEPEPEEESIISQAITALNSAVDTTTQKAQEATESADRAEHAAEGVESYAERAEAAQSAAESARDRAIQAETNARTSAATASEKASEAISSATTASQSALTAETASESARASATASAESASQASQSADTASGKASDASEYASNANTSAQTASQKASEAAQSASTAVQAKTDAETAKAASETAQGLAESARDEAVSAKTGAESARDEAQEIVDGITGKVEQIGSNTDRIESLEDDRYKPYPTDTASGSIASFSDGADDIPLKSCIVQIEPVQDLHGYDSPWPAGGGKNLFDKDAAEIGKWVNVSTGAIENTTTNYALSDYIPVKSGLPYVFTNPQSSRRWFYDAEKNPVETVASNPYTPPSDGFVLLTISVISVDINTVQFEQGTTLSAYSPYENICPITGWTGCEVQRTGVNVWDEEWEVGDLSYSGQPITASDRIRTKNFIHVIPNTAYYFKTGVSGQTSWQLFGCYYDEDKNFISTFYRRNSIFTMPSNCHYIKWTTTGGYGTIYNHDISINYPSTDHDYHSYTGQTYPITFPTEAGTVYGGYIDPINGELAACPYYASYNGETLTGEWISDRDKYVAGTTPTIGAQVVNIGAVGERYPLTPIEIKTLLGTNNIWSNTGDTEVTYRADTTLYIKRLTDSDTDMIADSNIVSGQYFMIGTDLYKSTVNIASGASVIVGTNATKVSLAQALNEINQ